MPKKSRPFNLRCKDTVKKLPKVIPPKKGKKTPYKRKKKVDLNETNT